MTDRELGVTIQVKAGIVMYHTVLCVGHDREPCLVRITTDPLDHDHLAQVVMHKTRSHGVAVQVARYVRRRFGVERPVETHRAVRPREAMVGYACTRTHQHPPSTYPARVYEEVAHVAATPVSTLLGEVADGHNAARTRYVVYEVRGATYRGRGVTNRFAALERRYREAPPDTVEGPVDVVQVGRYATYEEAHDQVTGRTQAGDHLWTRKPSVDYVRRVLRLEDGEIVWTCDGSAAVRRYATPSVCIGPQVYTEFQVRCALLHGEWPPNLNSHEGRLLGARLNGA